MKAPPGTASELPSSQGSDDTRVSEDDVVDDAVPFGKQQQRMRRVRWLSQPQRWLEQRSRPGLAVPLAETLCGREKATNAPGAS
ncbi:MAG TPA: hypothetical protein VK116_02200 [Planctomycetota bacterium]|nr:hypothetical protein [Planctomycetota bacterium]